MGESAVILEGEVARRFNPVDKLRATNQDSSVSDWVPSDTLDLGSLMASENTLYLANIDDDCDAYEEVEVDVSEELEDGDYKKITGKGNDGNDYAVGLDENGNLTSEMVPSAIHIVIKPRKLEYEEGETLDFTGIHVYLMDGNNHLFTSEDYPTGEIPFEELVFPVTMASETGDHGSIQRLPDYMEARIPPPLPLTGGARFELLGTYNWIHNVEISVSVTCIFFHTDSNHGVFIFASKEEFDVGNNDRKKDMEPIPITKDKHSSSYTNDGKIVHYLQLSTSWLGTDYPFTEIEDADSSYVYNYANVIAWYAIYGEVSGGNSGIPVQWLRSDGEMLEDNFSITVKPKPSTESNNSTSDSGSGHTSGGF